MVKVFPYQKHGFAHIGLGSRSEGAFKDEYEDFVDDEFGGAVDFPLTAARLRLHVCFLTARITTVVCFYLQ
jgi:hypothetical protein